MPNRTEIRAVGEFAASRHGAFNLSQAAEHNVTRQDIAWMQRVGMIEPVVQHVWRYVGHPTTPHQHLYAATLAVHSAGSHFSAAALQHVDGLEPFPAMPEVLVHHSDWTEIKGILVRRTRFLSTHDVTVVDGIVCTNLARTACDLAPYLTHSQLVRFVDDIQRRGLSMRWVMYRANKLNRMGRPGPPLVLDLVRRRLSGYRVPESVFERMLAECLKSPLLAGIVRQHRLVDERGDFVCRFDFAVPWARLGIEAHSRSYHLGELVERYDEDRDIRATKAGWETVYLGFAATKSPERVRHDIEQIVQRRTHDLGLVNPNGTQLQLLTR